MNDSQINKNDAQIEKSEAIASKILRVLAVIGLISVLILVTWVIVQGVRSLSNQNLASVIISPIRNVFQSGPKETLTFKLDTSTIASGETGYVAWEYEGENVPETYSFVYGCGTATTLQVMENTGWTDVACDTPFETKNLKTDVQFTNNTARFADVELYVTANELKDTTVITVVNTNIATVDTATTSTQTKIENTNTSKQETPKEVSTVPTTPVKTTPVYTQPVSQKISVPMYSGPADLEISIIDTGVVLEVAGENTLFPVSPISRDKVAGVKFAVINKGGVTSKAWTFKAELPIEGDKTYDYTSPIQAPILSGMQVEYTLSFDELLDADRGTIRITLVPSDNTDNPSNNKDSVIIKIKD